MTPGGVSEETREGKAASPGITENPATEKLRACHLQTLCPQQLSSPGSCDLELRRSHFTVYVQEVAALSPGAAGWPS